MQFNKNNIFNTIPYGPDSFYIPNFVLQVLGQDPIQLFETLQNKIDWVSRDNTAILYRGNQIRRTKGFFTANTDVDPQSGIPMQIYKYVYPGFSYRILLQHRCFRDLPALDQLITLLTDGLLFQGFPMVINHAIATQYAFADDCIGAHQDKLKSITPGTPIFSMSFGDTREMQLTDIESGNLLHTIVMEPGSLFVLGPETNARMKHAIVPIHEETLTKRPDGVVGPRISVVFRNIAVALSKNHLVEMVMKSITSTLKNREMPDVQREIERLCLQPEISLSDVCNLDSQFETARQKPRVQSIQTIAATDSVKLGGNIDDIDRQPEYCSIASSDGPLLKKIKVV